MINMSVINHLDTFFDLPSASQNHVGLFNTSTRRGHRQHRFLNVTVCVRCDIAKDIDLHEVFRPDRTSLFFDVPARS